jgi:hypothetical protein
VKNLELINNMAQNERHPRTKEEQNVDADTMLRDAQTVEKQKNAAKDSKAMRELNPNASNFEEVFTKWNS